MSQQIIAEIEKKYLKEKSPQLKSGDYIKVHENIIEGGKKRVQIFEGLIIKKNSGSGINKNITVRKIVDGVGVEKIFPIHSPNVEKIELIKQGKVRRAKLYFMRDRAGKQTRLKETKSRDLGYFEHSKKEPVKKESTETVENKQNEEKDSKVESTIEKEAVSKD